MCGVASLIVRKLWGVTVRCDADSVLIDFLRWYGCITGVKLPHLLWENCEVWRRFDWWFLWGFERPFKRRFSYVSIDFLRWAMTVWIYRWYTHVWSCLTNCEETVRCDADLIDDSCEALEDLSNMHFPYVSIDFLRWAMAVWMYGVYITGVKLPHLLWENCEVWRRFDWWFLWGFERPFERRFPYVSIDFLRWAMAVWIYGGYITGVKLPH